MKKTIALFAVASMVLLVAAPAAAFTTSVSSVIDASMVKAMAKWELKVKVQNDNDALITNKIESESDSGDNKIESADDMNTTSITTGDTDAAALADSTANTNSLEEDLQGAEDGTTTVSTVDDDSTVEVEVKDKNDEDVKNDNDVIIDDDVEAEADSGDNGIDSGDSLTGGSIASGKAMSAAGAVKLLNSNIKSILRR
ncbi:MAG: hypothetical protein COT91_02585 [Candidatus Doudnabacteria bacterium CG10_big_fil_rev_8_21_14_0_10_41_10]|uniref:Uncharacterized protein n=1 Tax=Candidatus Doudnabacteria bacterium CG10_big_fil_rev_8_21_14_0_10_41_10 TaxID=1974551 RepID=A0A2H0VDQ8_9BACT|nr:MAG: hypothetical protein COT91_02585 [Candidatus Doudnabacteria bacterium CG10_big_fil_rev_8_21_14_0_10_41_10]